MQRLFVYFMAWIDENLMHQIQFLKAENEILRSRLSGQVHTRPEERTQLLKFGQPLGDTVKDLISIVSYSTFQRWARDSERPRESEEQGSEPRQRGKGRPRTEEEIEDLVVRLARENAWGYSRVMSELKKLGIESVSRTTVKNILKRNGLDIGPKRGNGTWDEFVKRHISTLWACDFFSHKVLTWDGMVEYFVLFFIEIGTRKVRFFNMTDHPNAQWMAQQARNFCMICDEEGLDASYLIHDQDTKFTKQFDDIIRSSGCKPKELPYKSPNLNPYSESCVGTIRRECLDHFIVVGEAHLRHLLKEYVQYYNTVRPHSSMGGPLEPLSVLTQGEICCDERLGGLLKHYYRKAA